MLICFGNLAIWDTFVIGTHEYIKIAASKAVREDGRIVTGITPRIAVKV